MKTKLMMLVCAALIAMSGVCLAKIRNDQIALGGVPLLCQPKDLHRIYGEPTEFKKGNNRQETWIYGDSFSVRFVYGKSLFPIGNHPLKYSLVAATIMSSAANGIMTPDGVTVGNSVETMESIYGEADEERLSRKGDAYIYEYISNSSPGRLYFITNDGVIEEIECYYYI